MISVSNLSKVYGDRVLFAGASFQLNPGERYGLVGANGSGKTTLLSILSGDNQPSEGTVSIPKSARLGVLRQDQFLYEDEEILAVTLMGNAELWAAMSEKEKLLARAHEHFDSDRFSELEETVQRLDGYTAEARAATILEGLGLPTEVHHQPLSTLSGGFKLRVLLAQVLASTPDVLLLDEPTNHLDILSIRWLEKFLSEFAGPVVVISHDHQFLDNVTSNILDVDYATVTLYRGNYTRSQEEKRLERERREKEIEGRQKEIAHHQEFVDRFKAKASKARQAQSKLRMIERKAEELEELPGSSRRYPKFKFVQRRPSGRDVLKISGIRKAYGEKEILHGVDLQVKKGERVVILGPNGIGKSTLLKIVMGEVTPDAGGVEWGYETHPGYFAQDHHEQLDRLDRTAEQWLWEFCPSKDRGFVRGHLGLMLFSGTDGEKKLAALSGGEAARLVFSRLALQQPNVLVLDEPTNHLDLESIEALVAGLQAYDGTLLLVSHDRWFVRQLATRVVEVTHNGIRDYHGTYEEYLHACGDDHLDADVVIRARREDRKGQKKGDAAPATTNANGNGRVAAGGDGRGGTATAPARPKLSGGQRTRLQARLDEITAAIEAAEASIAGIDGAFCAADFYESTAPQKIRELESQRASLQQRVETLMEEWGQVEGELQGG